MIYVRHLLYGGHNQTIIFKNNPADLYKAEFPYGTRSVVVSYFSQASRTLAFSLDFLRSCAPSDAFCTVRNSLVYALRIIDTAGRILSAQTLALSCSTWAVSCLGGEMPNSVETPVNIIDLCERNAHLLQYGEMHPKLEARLSEKLRSCQVVAQITAEKGDISLETLLRGNSISKMMAFEIVMLQNLLIRAIRSAVSFVRPFLHALVMSHVCDILVNQSMMILWAPKIPYSSYLGVYMQKVRGLVQEGLDSEQVVEEYKKAQESVEKEYVPDDVVNLVTAEEFRHLLEVFNKKQSDWNARGSKKISDVDNSNFFIPVSETAVPDTSDTTIEKFLDDGRVVTEAIREVRDESLDAST